MFIFYKHFVQTWRHIYKIYIYLKRILPNTNSPWLEEIKGGQTYFGQTYFGTSKEKFVGVVGGAHSNEIE